MFTGTLKPYQPEAVDRMVERSTMLVAYEMGLGKTCMAIASCEMLMDKGKITAPVLVIALSSLKYQWAKEIEKFSNSKALVIDGDKKQRTAQYEQARTWADNEIDYVILNYEAVVNDWAEVSSLDIGAIVCDEATAIKSFKSQRSKKVKELSKKVQVKFALTGTPVENGKPEEIFSIMQFVDAKVLGRFDLFDDTFIVRNHFGGVERYRNLPILHKRLSEATVRKSQNDPDVAPYLPDTIQRDPLYVLLDPLSKDVYNQIASELLIDLEEAQMTLGSGFSLDAHYGDGQSGGAADKIRGAIMSKVTALRMLCDHPQLLVESSTKFDSGIGGSEYLSNFVNAELAEKLSKQDSNKLKLAVNYVLDHLDTDPEAKVVVFTTYLGMVDRIESALNKAKIQTRTYSGRMNAKEKEKSKTEFQKNPDIRVLISSDAGGYGVDLPEANMLLNYDLPWAAGAAIQRNSRIRRASSRWPSVILQDLLVSNTLEVRQHQMLQQKNAVADAVLDGKGVNDRGGISMTVGSLHNFLVTTRP